MEVHLTAEAEARLNVLAARTHRETNDLIQEAVDHLMRYNSWLETKVAKSSAAVERGETVPDEIIQAWMDTSSSDI